MELTKLDKSIPIKAIPEQELNTTLLRGFLPWLSKLLSLTDESSANKLETAFEAIKKHCWGMGFNEIKKMFEMYADGELEIKPISNYFDRVLLGNIVNAYRKQKPNPKTLKPIEIQMSQGEKDNLIFMGIVNCFDSYAQYGIFDGAYAWVHDVLMERGLFNFTVEQKTKLWEKAKKNVLNKAKSESYHSYKSLINQMERKQNTSAVVEYQYLRIGAYFDSLIAQQKHIKDLI